MAFPYLPEDLVSLVVRPEILAVLFVVVGVAAACVARLVANALPSSGPPVLEGLPFFGGVIAFLSGPLKLVEHGYRTKGEVFTVPVFHKKLTFLLGPHVVQPFFKSPDDAMSQEEVYKFNIPTFGPGVVYDVDYKIRNEQFRVGGDALKADALKSYLPLIKYETEEFFAKWDDRGDVDFFPEFGKLTTLTAARALLGREIREHLFKEVSSLLHDLDAGMVPISVFAPYLPIPVHRQRDRARKELQVIFSRVIQHRRASGVQEKDFLQHLINARYVRHFGGREFNDDEIGGLLIAMLFAGQHTSSVTSSWTGFCLVHNPEWMEKCIQEQREVMAAFGSDLSCQVLDNLPVLHSCIREALRMNPPLMLLMRYARQSFDVTTSKGIQYTIPKGHIVLTSPTFAGRMPHVFEVPEKFDPARYLPPREEDKQLPFSYLPFGAGRHACMGHNYAFLQIKTIWSHVLRNFELHKIDPFPEADYDSMVVGIRPCRVGFRRRRLQAAARD